MCLAAADGGGVNPAALTDDGALAANVDLPGTTTESAVVYRRAC